MLVMPLHPKSDRFPHASAWVRLCKALNPKPFGPRAPRAGSWVLHLPEQAESALPLGLPRQRRADLGRSILYTTTTQGRVVYRGFRLNSGTVAVSKIISKRWWCIESLFPWPWWSPAASGASRAWSRSSGRARNLRGSVSAQDAIRGRQLSHASRGKPVSPSGGRTPAQERDGVHQGRRPGAEVLGASDSLNQVSYNLSYWNNIADSSWYLPDIPWISKA